MISLRPAEAICAICYGVLYDPDDSVPLGTRGRRVHTECAEELPWPKKFEQSGVSEPFEKPKPGDACPACSQEGLGR